MEDAGMEREGWRMEGWREKDGGWRDGERGMEGGGMEREGVSHSFSYVDSGADHVVCAHGLEREKNMKDMRALMLICLDMYTYTGSHWG